MADSAAEETQTFGYPLLLNKASVGLVAEESSSLSYQGCGTCGQVRVTKREDRAAQCPALSGRRISGG